MNKPVGLIVALMGFSLATLSAQSPSPAASPETSPSPAKHRHAKKEASAAAAESPAAASSVPEASASPAKQKRVKKDKSAATTSQPATPVAAVSPSPAKHSWFGSKSASPTPAPAPVAATSAAATSAAKTVSAAPAGPIAAGGGPGMVWVNTESHTYHKQGSRWYGRTKKGKYLSEQDAIKEGAHEDKGEAKEKKKP